MPFAVLNAVGPQALGACAVAASNARFDQLEQELVARGEPIEAPVTHHFIPGFYVRQIFMPKGAILTSKIHLTRHPYVVTKGDCSVWVEGVGTVRLKAGHVGITEAGTRRVLFTHEDTVWTTFHPTEETDLKQIEENIIFKHDEHLALDEPRSPLLS